MMDFKILVQLIVLFTVIFDPLASFVVFLVATKSMKNKDRNKIAILSLVVAGILSFLVLIFGKHLLNIFSTDLNDFRVAGGIILGILGVKMALGHSLIDVNRFKNSSAVAIAAIIGTPLLTGPAAITTIMITTNDYGILITGLAVAIVLIFSGILMFFASKIYKITGMTPIQVGSTVLGLITLAWGVKFIRIGLGF